MAQKTVKLQSWDQQQFLVDHEVLSMCATVKNLLRGRTAFRNSLGGQFCVDGSYVILKKEGRILASLVKNDEMEAVISFPEVSSTVLTKVLEYCKYHYHTLDNEKDQKIWDAKFIQVKQSILCEMASASYFLDIKTLVNLTSRAIAAQISGKSPEEIRETFSIITQNYDSVYNSSLDVRARLHKKISERKQIEPAQPTTLPSNNNNLPQAPSSPVLTEAPAAQLSISQLANFIEQPSKKKTGKNAKKNKKKKKEEKMITPQEVMEELECESPEMMREDGDILTDNEEDEFDGIDPQMMAALDKEVEEFRQRLEQMRRISFRVS
ncbi:hypothetical protein PROFUN_02565 [Planoprotostelium fungivorum]|uniref:SKP1 component POZ domain-containing protein n=1 Tax=Planoprotostelium fungivorum TaxID=1890364 RepID=A0A2P6MPF6_9EUKA|nr:hypothetical protein PROFUN_02565 [Planoprotostelium fungivorum]